MTSSRYGWASRFIAFRDAPPTEIRLRLERTFADAESGQRRAWSDSIPVLQREVRAIVDHDPAASAYVAALEYELPLEKRRPDVVLLLAAPVLVLELKGKERPDQADLDQASAYARDLRGYHVACHDRDVIPVVIPMRAHGYLGEFCGVHVMGPDAIHGFAASVNRGPQRVPPVTPEEFVADDAYEPLPSLIEAARRLFQHGDLPHIHRAYANTQPAVEAIAEIIHEAARTKSRRLVLVTGVPGAGKTLVGLRLVHARFLDDLAVVRAGRKRVPAVFLSGNAPLVTVLQYELGNASKLAHGPSGKEFVRGVKEYLAKHAKPGKVPSEHVLVFDEAQRAWDAPRVRAKHDDPTMRSEPEHFIEFAGRIPEWSVVVGLIGTGQEIHAGEEGGLALWCDAVRGADPSLGWTVHGPMHVADAFSGSPFVAVPALNLDKEIRSHFVRGVHGLVSRLLDGKVDAALRPTADEIERQGYALRVTRDLEVAKAYLRSRYAEQPSKRYGILVSSRDKSLGLHGVPPPTKDRFDRFPTGPWFANGADAEVSCRHLSRPASEFESQGLELDAVLLAWGGDLVVYAATGEWTNSGARTYQRKSGVRDPLQLRKNAYRVLLTRAREATVVFVPPEAVLDATYARLVGAGWRPLGAASGT